MRRSHSTSARAGVRSRRNHARQRGRILRLLKRKGFTGATAEGISRTLRIPMQSVWWRLRELRDSQSICNSGRERDTHYGCAAIVWMFAKAKRRAAKGRSGRTPRRIAA